MINDMHSKPGDEILSSMGGINPIAPKDIFRKPLAGGAPRRPKPANADGPPEEALEPLEPEAGEGDSAPSDQEKAKEIELSQLQWSLEKGNFNEKVTATLQAKLAPGREHLTRLSITLFALDPEGKRERIDAKETHIQEGRAEQEFTLYYPQFKVDGNLPTGCNYIFTAKHRDSKEFESRKLPVSAKKSPCIRFKERLAEAIKRLKPVAFGRAEGGLGSRDKKERLDDEFWQQGIEWNGKYGADVVELKPGKSYSEAIIKIIERPDEWSLDCMQFVQVVLLYALVDPEDQASFDNRFRAEKRVRTFPSTVEKPFESSGLSVNKAFQRNDPALPMKEWPAMVDSSDSLEVLLGKAPIGSRVTWRCLDAQGDSARFSNENTVKVGPDAYAAHPFNKVRGPMSRAEMESELASIVYPTITGIALDGKKQSRIFICDISIFDTPCS